MIRDLYVHICLRRGALTSAALAAGTHEYILVVIIAGPVFKFERDLRDLDRMGGGAAPTRAGRIGNVVTVVGRIGVNAVPAI